MEMNFNDAGRFDARAQNILFRRHVVRLTQTVKVVKETEIRKS